MAMRTDTNPATEAGSPTRVMVEGYPHVPGEHCASTALRNIMQFHGTELSEGMIVGLAAGLGFYYICSESTSPSRMFHGRTFDLEQTFCKNIGIPFEDRPVTDDALAWSAVKQKIDSGLPVMVSTDTFYLEYQNTTSHFPGHRAVIVGYDETRREVYIADRKYDDYQTCSLDELRRARNAPDYPMSCHNQYGDFLGEVRPAIPLDRAIRIALRANADWMFQAADPDSPGFQSGIPAMRTLASDFARWEDSADWSWAARFGYQIVIKRGAGGSFFRSLYADFLKESADFVPEIAAAGLPERMTGIARQWRDFAAVLKEQSERETCSPELFRRAGEMMGGLADSEESFFRDALAIV